MDTKIWFALVLLFGLAGPGPTLAGAQTAQNLGFGPVVRNSDGSIAHMDFDQATIYCQSKNMHVPSAIEWAHHAVESGALGTSDTARAGFTPVWKMRDGSTKTVLFYFNSTGYQPGPDEEGTFWTSEPTWGSVVQMSFRSNSTSADFWEFTIGNSSLEVRCAY